METVVCENCSKTHAKKSLRRSCSNCFLCTGCEIYKCPKCGQEIIVTPMRIAEYGQRSTDPTEPETPTS